MPETAGSGGPQSTAGAPAPQLSRPSFTLDVAETIALRSPSRGAAPGALPTISVGPTTRIIQFQVEPPDVPEGSRVRVTLTGTGGKVLIDEMHRVEDFFNGRTLAVQSQLAFRQGRYLLTIAGQRDGSREEVSYPFVITIDAR